MALPKFYALGWWGVPEARGFWGCWGPSWEVELVPSQIRTPGIPSNPHLELRSHTAALGIVLLLGDQSLFEGTQTKALASSAKWSEPAP